MTMSVLNKFIEFVSGGFLLSKVLHIRILPTICFIDVFASISSCKQRFLAL